MITVRLQPCVLTDNPVKHESADGFLVEDGFLFVSGDGKRIAAYPVELIVSVVKEDSCCKQ